jgi:hypothetical protein
LVKIFSLHHELGQPRNAVRNPARLVRREMVMREAEASKIVAAVDIGSGTPLASKMTNGPAPSRWTCQGGGKHRLGRLDFMRTE